MMNQIKEDFKTNYFQHDFNASHDPKITKLIIKKGLEGYGLFWVLVEMLHSNKGVLDYDIEFLANVGRCSEELVKSVINDFDLFIVDGTVFSSNRVVKQLRDIINKSQKARKAANVRHHSESNNIDKFENELLEYNGTPSLLKKNGIDSSHLKTILKSFTKSIATSKISKDYKYENYKDDFQKWLEGECSKGSFSKYKMKLYKAGDL